MRALVSSLNFDVHGVPGTLTVPTMAPVDVRVIWLVPDPEEVPVGARLSRVESRRVACVQRNVIAAVPLDSDLVAPEHAGGVDRTWRVDGFDRREPDHHRLIVVATD